MLNETFLWVFYNCSRKILKVCSRSVLEQSKVNSRTVLEQIIRTFLEQFWNHSTDVLELFRDIYRTLNGTFFRGVLQLFQKNSKGLFWISSRKSQGYSRTVLEQTIRTFLE